MNNLPDREYQIVRGGIVLDVQSRSVEPADILLKGDSIAEIGRPGMPCPDDALLIDADDQLVMPGLINAHTHGPGSLGKGMGDKWSLELLLNSLPWLAGGFTLDDKRIAAQLNAAEMVLKGCTAAYDLYFEPPKPSLDGLTAAGQAYADVGVRAVIAPMMADTSLYVAIDGLLDSLPDEHREQVRQISMTEHSEHLAACRNIIVNWPFDRDIVRPALGPTIPIHCTDDFLAGCRDLASDFDLGIQMHLAESKSQAITGLRRYGRTLTAHLDELGVLSERFTGAHCIWLDDDDMKRMRDSGASVAHNPGSNLRVGSGIAPIAKLRDCGLNVGIGTDGSASSDNQNMFEALRAAAFVSRVVEPDPERWLGTWDVLEMATMGSARALGMGNAIGRLGVGYKADLVFLDLSSINFVPLNDPANQIANCEDSSSVRNVMIGGRMVLADRRFLHFDYDELRRKAQIAVARLAEANAGTRFRMEAMAKFVASHCTGLVCSHYHVERRLDPVQVS